MADDVDKGAGTGDSDSGAGGSDADAPKPVDINALLADEAAADTQVKVGDLKPFLESHRASIVADAEATFLKRQQEREAAARSQADQNAAAQEDIDFAKGIFENLASGDADVRAEAEAKMSANRDRYNRGRDLQFRRDSTEAQTNAVNSYLAPIWQHVQEAGGYTDLVDVLKPDGALMQEAGGNWLLAAMKHAETRGYERGKSEAVDEADQRRRVDEGAGGPHRMGGGGDAGGDAMTDGVKLGTPGSTRLLRERREALRKQ